MKITELIRQLEEIRREEGDIDVELPDGTPVRKITLHDLPASYEKSRLDKSS